MSEFVLSVAVDVAVVAALLAVVAAVVAVVPLRLVVVPLRLVVVLDQLVAVAAEDPSLQRRAAGPSPPFPASTGQSRNPSLTFIYFFFSSLSS